MDYSFPGSGGDPFRCLDSDLDEMLNTLNDPNLNAHHGDSMEAMDTSGPSMNYNPTTPPSAYLHQSIVSHSSHAPLSVSPPYGMGIDAHAPSYNFYKQPAPSGSSSMHHVQQDPYGGASSAMENGYGEFKFSPPDFTPGPGPTSRMLPPNNMREDTKYYNSSQQQHLQHMQPSHHPRHSSHHSRMAMQHQQQQHHDIATLLTPMEQRQRQHPGAVIVKRERSPEPLAGGKATRDQLIKLLTSLSKSDVDRLQESIDAVAVPSKVVDSPPPPPPPERTPVPQSSVIAAVGRVRPSAVATRVVVPKYEQLHSPVPAPASLSLSFPLVPAADLRARHESFDDFDEDDEDDEEIVRGPSRKSSTVGSEGGPPRPKTERRTAHNLIEKKYRCSINDRIQTLKNMLSGGSKVMSKSATLRRAIEYIEDLESKNRELTNAVNALNSLCNANGIDSSKCLIIDSAPVHSPNSPASSPMLSTSSSNQTSPIPHSNSKKRSRMSMDQNTARVSLCAIMFALIVWNPIASFTSRPVDGVAAAAAGSELAAHLPSRTLQSLDGAFDPSYSHDNDYWWQDRVIRPCFAWSINILVVIAVLSRLLVYGEPVQDMKSQTWAAFLATKRQAHAAFEMGNHKEAHRQLVECLNILDRPLPSSFFEESMAIIWQIIRHLLNSLWIGRWISRRRRDERKPVTVVCKSHAHTAMIYHQLNQLDLLGINGDLAPSTRLRGLYFALTAVNISESAGSSVDGLPHIDHANIHMGAALRCRITLPKFLAPVLAKYFFTRSRRHVRKMSPGSSPALGFIFHPMCRKFVSDPTRLRNCLEDGMVGCLFTKASVKGLSIDRIRNAFKVHLLNQLLESLRQPNPAGSAHYSTLDIVDASQLLLTISTATAPPSTHTSFGWEDGGVRGDEISTWWAHVLTCGMLWRQDKLEQAKSHYALVRKVPPQLVSNPLTLAVGHAFCARKLRTDDMTHANSPHLMKHNAQKTIDCLRALPALNAADGAAVVKLQESLRLLSLEWTLCCVLALWRSNLNQNEPYWSQEVSPDWLALYQSAHSMLTQYSAQTGFSLTSRMLAGANAVQTYSELLRLQRRVNDNYARLPSTRDDTALSYHLHVLTKLHLCMNGSTFRVKTE
ncbi:sbp-1 [Pristionchus pacificus]|uniref:Sbp-1 n=1 Tax=Pristionchus pacificus TaxID=54126 RepID=A0A2A6CHX0_PRIPA|nr:sbp-1 [Pristionchus pacificus]|eukprot:PDM77696.1 sbp-1 [Pristionchus pacificus]